MNDVFVTSVPKSGTHLLYYILGFPEDGGVFRELGIDFGNECYADHAPHDSELHADKVRIFLRRHPGDILVSWAYYLEEVQEFYRSPFNFPELAAKGMDIQEAKDKLNFLLIHAKSVIEGFVGWMGEDIHKLRYEDLLNKPREVLAPIAADIDCSLDLLVAKSRFRGGRTFRAGRIGDWKDEFKPHHLKRFELDFGEIMDAFEYD